MQSVTIKIFLAKGNPESLNTAEISNWTGKAISAPRTELKELLKREELDRPGVYILVGADPETSGPAVYIGEADSVVERIKGHSNKDFWSNILTIVSKDENLTKAHSKYIEGKLIEKAAETGRVKLMNSMSSGARLSESDIAEMDVFLNNIYQLLPVMEINFFRTREEQTSAEEEMLYCEIKGLTAFGKRSPSGFVIFKNSQAVLEHRPSAHHIRIIREKLVSSGTLIPRGAYLSFADDVEFGSPSTAGGVVRGGNTNGLTAWKNKDGKSLKELEIE